MSREGGVTDDTKWTTETDPSYGLNILLFNKSNSLKIGYKVITAI